MPGEKKLSVLIKSMKPELQNGSFVFCSVTENQLETLYKLNPIMIFREGEGITVILQKEQADRITLPYSQEWALITLKVHSSLEAVGFLAQITRVLAELNISVNAVSAFYHDHLFVPFSRKNEALTALNALSSHV